MGGNLSSVVDVTRQRCDQSTAVNSGPMPFKVGSIAGAGVAGSLDSLDLLEQQLQPIGFVPIGAFKCSGNGRPLIGKHRRFAPAPSSYVRQNASTIDTPGENSLKGPRLKPPQFHVCRHVFQEPSLCFRKIVTTVPS